LRVLLTGATGFVGSHVARALVREGHEVHAVVRPGSPRRGELPGEVRVVARDAVPGRYLADVENVACLEQGLRLARELARFGCRRFVGVGTCFEYEHGPGSLREDAPAVPRTLYAACKLALWHVLEPLGSTTGMEVAWARLFYTYGPHEHEARLVPSVIRALRAGQPCRLTAGEQVRDFLHVEDVAAALVALAVGRVTGVVNVASGRPVTVRDVVTTIASIVGGDGRLELGALPYSPGDPMSVCADVRRLTREVGFLPRFDLDAGLRQTVAWWSERELQASRA
jgi:nucleoside-diphosphate-sugar epimerase